ncbi:RQC-minor-1 family DNA-binding protein [uncultured Catenibacterium sp.]|uniref:RQC-minor-1 family DNA-binding protein n=1 Tax=uncultured Catenibacterium sp. TaxID=286142 RepID=UPI0025F8EA8F|nr:RQC-minor-1 family DNA-binding protein [uncultured Catenibacterium sp.]
MSRRVNRIPVILDTGNVKELSPEDIKMILRAADMCIMKAGRNMLAKILKGSKDKKVLELKLNECPAYGYYHNMKLSDIMHCIDWMIDEDYLRIKYDGRLPLLVFSDQGWEIEKETYAQELYQQFCLDVKENNPRVIHKLIHVNRKVIFRILDIIEAEGTKEFIPCLEAYRQIETKRVGRHIIEVENAIKDKV